MHAFESPLALPPSPPPAGYPASTAHAVPAASPSASASASASADPQTAWAAGIAGSLAAPHSRAASPVQAPGAAQDPDLAPAPHLTSSSAVAPDRPPTTPPTSAPTSVERPVPSPATDILLHPSADRSTFDLARPSTQAVESSQPPGPTEPLLSAPPSPQPPLGSPRPGLTISTAQAPPASPGVPAPPTDAPLSQPRDAAPPPASSTGPSGLSKPVAVPPSRAASRSPRPATFSAEEATELERERTRERRPKRVLNGYVLGKTLGAGSMGKVKLATLSATGLKVAIKMVPRHTSVAAAYEQARKQAVSSGEGASTSSFAPPAPAALARAREKDAAKELRAVREGSLQLLLYHPYVCGVRELIVQPHYYYLVEEYVSGGQLLDYIIAHGRLRERVARRFARQLLSAFTYLHANNVVHRDLKIENILLSEAGHVKLVDFGLANLWSPHRALRTFCGSLYFAAPELLRARPYVGPEVDVWSLGVVLFVLVAGRVPFDDPSVSALHRKIQQGHVQYPAHLSSDCRHALGRMLTVDPQLRATLPELASHPFFTKGHDGPPDSHLPRRMPLRPEELDRTVLKHMQGFAFGDPDEIERKLIQILTSDAYLAALAAWDNRHGHAMGPDSLSAAPLAPPRPPPLRPSRPSSSHGAEGEGDDMPPPEPASLDPTAGFHPMLSVYYLVREKLEREQLSGGIPAFAEAALKVPSALAPSSAPTPIPAPSSRTPDYGSSMPTADDIPASPSTSGFGSNALPPTASEGRANPSPSPAPPASHTGPSWGLPVPQRPAETMRWSRGMEMPGMVSGLGDVGITTAPPAALRGLDHGSSDTLSTAPGARASSSSGRAPRSQPPTGSEGPLPPPSPVQTRVPVFDTDYRDRSRPVGEMRGPPRSRDAGAQLDQMVSTPRSSSAHTGAPSRSSISSARSGPMSRTPSATTNAGLGIGSGEGTSRRTAFAPTWVLTTRTEMGGARKSLGSPSRERHTRGMTLGAWRGSAVSALSSWKADEHVSAPTLQPEEAAILTPPRRAASMHSKLTTVPRLSESTSRPRLSESTHRWTDSGSMVPTEEEDVTPRAGGAPAEAGPLASLKKLGQIMSRSISMPFNDSEPAALDAREMPGPEATEHSAKAKPQPDADAPDGGAKAVFLKGLFSVQTTSSRAPEKVQALLAAALTRMGVHFHAIPGGFECVHAPSLALAASAASGSTPTSASASAAASPPAHPPTGQHAPPELQAQEETEGMGTLDLGWQASEDVASTDPPSPATAFERDTERETLASPLSPALSSFRVPWRRRALPAAHTPRAGSVGSESPASLAGTATPDRGAGAAEAGPAGAGGPGTESGAGAAAGATSGPAADAGAGGGAGAGVTATALEEMCVRFELCVVRVPLLGVSGVQFRRVAGNPWQYQLLAKRILEEAKI